MSDPIPLAEQIAEAERELHTRLSVYPRRVSNGKMTQAKADQGIATMRAIIDTLRGINLAPAVRIVGEIHGRGAITRYEDDPGADSR